MHSANVGHGHGMNGFSSNSATPSSSNQFSNLQNGNTPLYSQNIPIHHRQLPQQQIQPVNHNQWNGPMRHTSVHQLPIPHNQPFNQQPWSNPPQMHSQQFPNGMPPMTTFNMPYFSSQVMQDPFIGPPVVVPSAPVDRSEEKIILQVLVECNNRRASYKDALNSLHGKNGHSASQWKDYYLDHKDRLDETISLYLNPPKVAAIQAIKKPSPSAFKAEPSPARSLQSNSKRQGSIQRTASSAAASKRNTINSLTAPAPVYGDRLPAPNAEIQIPEPPSRSPSPPTVVIPHRGRGNKFTPQDREFFLKFIAWRLKGDPSLTRTDLCNLLAEKAPHHSAQSWASHWSNKHDVPDKILAAAKGDDYGSDESDSEEEVTRPTRRRPRYKESSSEESDEEEEEKDTKSESDEDEEDDEAPIRVYSESEMGQKGGPFTDADLYITAKYILASPNFDDLSGKERWEPFSERFPQRSWKSWNEYYRRYEKGINKLVKKMKRRGQQVSPNPSPVRRPRGRPSLASKKDDSQSAKRKHSADPADGVEDERPPSRNKRGRGEAAT